MIKVRVFLTDYEIEELSFFASSESIGKLHALATAKIKEYCASKDWRYNPHAWDVKVTVPAIKEKRSMVDKIKESLIAGSVITIGFVIYEMLKTFFEWQASQ